MRNKKLLLLTVFCMVIVAVLAGCSSSTKNVSSTKDDSASTTAPSTAPAESAVPQDTAAPDHQECGYRLSILPWIVSTANQVRKALQEGMLCTEAFRTFGIL